ncbi:MAG: hypothetical protein DRP74_03200 [Candidatus Omnitrophota bacterium]|nr:MAG: hypothetical protein DRP74_03200 [Candidatus Omnitrophota bacterium]
MPEKAKIGEILISAGLINKEQLDEALKEQKEKGGYVGQILINKGLVTQAEFSAALKKWHPDFARQDSLAEMLVKENIITQDQLNKAVAKSNVSKQPLSEVLVDFGFITEEAITRALSKFLNIPYIKLTDYTLTEEITHSLPESIVRRNKLIPVKLEKDTLYIAMADPLNLAALEEVKLTTNFQIRQMVAAPKEIAQAIEQHFNIQQTAKKILMDIRTEGAEAEDELLFKEGEIKDKREPAISRLVDTIINGGITARASDIHFEPQYPEMRLRYRIDGVLHDIMTIPKTIESAVISRIKILADMDITEHRRPQDGHITMSIDSKNYDLRVASFATVGGEKIVVRILDKNSMLFGLNELGFSNQGLDIFNSLISKNYGIILVTGPTGSGKTTTLYAAINQMDKMTKNIVTIEDPVEYRLEGINQAQVNPLAGVTFATGLRSILRQDPDIIMVGEIRDLETAQIAVHAALTGHLVFSTLHTNDAPSAIARLIDMGIDPFLISSSLIGVIAQRLVRIVCPECIEEYRPDDSVLHDIGLERTQEKDYTFVRGKGCQYCINTGYRGRNGVFEIMSVTDSIRDMIINRQPANKIKGVAIKEGMTTLRQSAIQKVIEGLSTIKEIERVIFVQE